jgi:hypothetical protein
MLEWLQNPVIAIVLAIGAMFFGYFFGLMEGRGQGEKKRRTEESEKKETEPASEPLPPASPPAPPDEVPVLDVSMDNAGQLRLKLDGERIEAATLIPEQRKRMIAVLTQLRPLLETPTPAPPPARPQPASSPKEASPSGTMPVSTPSSSLGLAPLPAKANDEPVTAPQSIVEQIDSILQAQMVGTPLIEKGIRLQESPEGGVIVWVGINKYEGVAEVPDEQIQAAIRAAIAVWENKFTPGL